MSAETVPGKLRKNLGIDGNPSLDSWQDAPDNRWVFRHIEETVPNGVISRVAPEDRWVSTGLGRFSLLPDLEERLQATCTDGLVVLKDGQLVGEYYAPGFGPEQTHLLMSVSKSLCGIVVGTLIDDGLLDPAIEAVRYVPDLAGTAFGDATLRQLLDMTTSVDYSEEYTDATSEVQQHDRAAGWRERQAEDPGDVYEFLRSLGRTRPHGERFQYCSAVTDALAWVAESVTGQRYAELVSARLWSRIGAERDARIGVDRGGFAFANGGIACTARDLARVGQMMLGRGQVGDTQVVSDAWVDDTMCGGDVEMTVSSPKRAVFPNYSYRNQWWSVGDDRGSVHGVGIHGQYLWLDPSSNTVIVKFSSEAEPTAIASTRTHFKLFSELIEVLESPDSE